MMPWKRSERKLKLLEKSVEGYKIRKNKNWRTQTYSSTDILFISIVLWQQLAITRHPEFNYSFLTLPWLVSQTRANLLTNQIHH